MRWECLQPAAHCSSAYVWELINSLSSIFSHSGGRRASVCALWEVPELSHIQSTVGWWEGRFYGETASGTRKHVAINEVNEALSVSQLHDCGSTAHFSVLYMSAGVILWVCEIEVALIHGFINSGNSSVLNWMSSQAKYDWFKERENKIRFSSTGGQKAVKTSRMCRDKFCVSVTL